MNTATSNPNAATRSWSNAWLETSIAAAVQWLFTIVFKSRLTSIADGVVSEAGVVSAPSSICTVPMRPHVTFARLSK